MLTWTRFMQRSKNVSIPRSVLFPSLLALTQRRAKEEA